MTRPAGTQEQPAAGTGSRSRRLRAIAWILSIVFLAGVAGTLAGIVRHLRNTVWCHYTDDVSIRESAEESAGPWPILWEDPYPAYGASNVAASVHEAAFSADDLTMVFTRAAPGGTNADLYACTWDGRAWSEPEAITDVNGPANEIGPALSRDGRYLYFASDREGGLGGYDIWAARRDGSRWTGVTNLGPSVNSPHDERGPAPWPDGSALLFTSDRPLADDAERDAFRRAFGVVPDAAQHDIFRAAAEAPHPAASNAPAAKSARVLPEAPRFAAAERVLALCSAGNDLQPEPTPRGDAVYLASDRRGGLGGLDLYCARVVRGSILPAMNLGVEINRPGDDTAPALRMEGFDMVFSSNRGQADRARFLLYASTCREVVAALDLSRWQCFVDLLNRTKWWIAILLSAILALVYLLRHYREMTSLYHKCLMGSVIVHVVILIGAAFWFISAEFVESLKPDAGEIKINAEALAREKLAVKMNEQVAELPKTDMNVVQQEKQPVQQDFVPPAPLTPPPIAAKTPDQSFVNEVQAPAPVDAQQTAMVKEMRTLATLELPLIETPKVDVTLEVREAPKTAESQLSKEEPLYEPEVVQPKLTVAFKDLGSPSDKPAAPMARADDVSLKFVTNRVADAARILKAGQVLAVASIGSETAGPKPALSGVRNLVAEMTAKEGTGINIAMVTPDALEVPVGIVAGGDGSVNGLPEAAEYQDGVTVSRAGFRRPGKGPAFGVLGPEDVAGAGVRPSGSGSSMVRASAGGEVGNAAGAVSGMGDIAGMVARFTGNNKEYRVDAPFALDVPSEYNNPNPHLFKNRGKFSAAMVEALGGSAETEGAIGRGLDWFTTHQEPNGRWDIAKYGGEKGHDMAATALALLCYYGWGAKHTEAGPHQEAVRKALEWVVSQQDKEGYLGGAAGNGMYDHGMGAIALSEAYGMTKDEKILLPAQKAIAFLCETQGRDHGGWRYRPRANDSDTSVFGWQYMALRSAEMAGLNVREGAFDRAAKWLDRVAGGKHGGLYGYQAPEASRPAMIATGMFCRQLARVPPTHPSMIEGALFMRNHTIESSRKDLYYIYYATLCLYQHQGEIWEKWNEDLKRILPAAQLKTGEHAGSWDTGLFSGHVAPMGRSVVTALCVLSLEVYYRILPIYGYSTWQPTTNTVQQVEAPKP